MADSDSDGEFERFLQEDEDSLSPEPARRRPKPAGAYSSSSASAVTAAAAALLASSKLAKNHKSKSKSKIKSSDKKKSSKKSSRTQLSDSDEAPPSYYDDYSTRPRGGGLEDSDADPYAFDMSSPAYTTPAKKDKYSDSESEEEYVEKKKNKKEDFKNLAKKAIAKTTATTAISMEDRIAEILKRTGSTQFQAEEKGDEGDLSEEETPARDAKETPEPLERNEATNDDQDHADGGDSGSEAERSSLSDSLGVGSADFEVRLPPRQSIDRKRLSLSSLDSEKFAVNREALDNELATPSRYEQQQMTFSKSEQDEDSSTEKDEYGDDDFELDHSAVNDSGPPPYSTVQDTVNAGIGEKAEESFVSEFDKMKELLLADAVSATANEPTESRDGVHPTEQSGELYSSGSLITGGEPQPMEASDTFGYGDEEFEETLESRQDEHTSAKLTVPDVAQSTAGVEYSADYEDDAFEADTGVTNEVTAAAPSEPLQAITETPEPAVQAVVDLAVDKDSKLNSLLAKYGDFYTLDEEDDEKLDKNDAQQPIESQAPPSTEPEISTTTPSPIPEAATQALEPAQSPPSSPPPPPPPDEDEDDDPELNRFALDAPTDSVQAKAEVTAAQQVRENRSIPSTPADRFREIENHVASLRFVQPAGAPTITAANSPATEAVHPVSARVLATHQDATSRVPPPYIEPMSISFDAGLLAEDEDTQREIDEFVRSSQIMRHETRAAAQRASIARENGLMLRLQQAQRQILQLKEHIQATARNDPSAPERGNRAASGPIDADNGNGEQDSNELGAVKEATSGISQAAYSKLQKEIKTQDNLIAAFQKENERLMQQLKQVRQDVQYDVHEANEELRRQIKKLQDQAGEAATIGAGGDLTSKAQYRVAVEARLEAEAHAIALQEELAGARLSYQQKLNEVTLELDRVKKAKLELECRYEGVNLTQVAQEAKHARELQSELDLAKKEHAHALSALQKKLDWYVENQRLLDDQDEELRRLRRQVAAQSSEAPAGTPSKEERLNVKASPARSHRRSPTDIRRIQELEGRLAELEEAMRRRHPDSLANLILASRRADEESKTRALERDYEDKLTALSRELEQAHEASETRLASFRQQQEKLLLQYRRKIKEQEKQLKQLSKAPLSHRATSKDSTGTSDAELAKVRRFYTDKIKELERKWEAKYRSLRKQQYSGLSSNQQVQDGLTYADSSLVIANLQRQIREQELELKQEKARVEQLEAESQLPALHPEDSSSATNDIPSKSIEPDQQLGLEKQIADLKSQLEDSESARARLAQTLATVQTLGLARALNSETTPSATETEAKPVIEPTISKEIEAELSRLRQDLAVAREALTTERAASTEKVIRLEKQITEQTEKNAVLEAQLTGNQREMESLQTLALEAERHNRALEAQARRVPELKEEVLALRRELELPRTPSMVQYRSLELKVATLEQKHKLREAELKVVLDRALTSTHLEQLSRERAHRAAIAAKNSEIASFKRQLEEILDELAQLQQPPSLRAKRSNQPEHKEEEEEDVPW